jgi:hypothetical protein
MKRGPLVRVSSFGKGLGLQKFVIFSMSADPEPNDAFRLFGSEGTVVSADSDGPELFAFTDFFEMQ